MPIKHYLVLINRRRRRCALNVFLILLCIYLFFQMHYTFMNPLSIKNLKSMIRQKYVFKLSILNCSEDPLQQWCENQMHLCNSSLIVYNKLFLVTRSVILQPKLAQGKRLGGEDIQQVLNQREEDEYFHFEKGFLQVRNIFFLFIIK
jgi:hypothetical protein